MFKFGFELEGFLCKGETVVPPGTISSFPKDGFPGLIELRTTGGKSLEEAYGEIIEKYLSLPKVNDYYVDFSRHTGKFSSKEWFWMRKHESFDKENVDIRNIYSDDFELDFNTTFASLQINISNEISPKRITKEGEIIPAQYGLFNINSIIKNLDEEFKEEILDSDRPKGMYAIKDWNRLEYRSLPNYVFPLRITEAGTFIYRIKKCIKE